MTVRTSVKFLAVTVTSAALLAACAPAAPAPAPAAPAAPVQQQAAPMAAPTEAPVAAATMAPAAAASTAVPAAEAQAQAQPAAMGPVVLKIVSGESRASYTAAKTAINRNNRVEDIVGATTAVNGQITLDAANPSNTTVGKIDVDIAAFDSGSSRRDSDMNREWFDIARFPFISFEPTQLEGLPTSYELGQELTFKMTGNMTLRDKTAPVTFDVKATYDGEKLVGTATAPVTISSFGIEAPSALGIFSVADDIKLQFDFVAAP